MNFEDIYEDHVSVICRSKETSDRFRQFLSLNGVLWGSGSNMMDEDHWDNRSGIIRYTFHEYDRWYLRVYYDNSRNCVENAMEYHYIIIEADEINMTGAPTRDCDSALLMEFFK